MSRRVGLWLLLFLTAMALVLGTAIYAMGLRALDRQIAERLTVEADYLTRTYQRDGLDHLVRSLRHRDERGVNPTGYLLRDAGGRHLAGDLVTPSALQPGWAEIAMADADGETVPARALTQGLAGGYRLTVAMALTPMARFRQAAAWSIALVGLSSLAGGAILAALMTRALRARLGRMNDTALAIIAGENDQRMPEDGRDDEFRDLARTLNRMLARHEALVANLRQVSSDIAHDLRTPLAHLGQRLERALALAQGAPALEAEIAAAMGESEALLGLFAALLRISEVESGTLRAGFAPVDLSDLVARLGDGYGAVAEEGGRTLTCHVAPGVTLTGDAALLAQALVNLLDNALVHTPLGTTVALDLHVQADETLVLAVHDNGPGVPAEALPGLARRFTRADRARQRPGFGLGLNLVQAIAVMHEGRLDLANDDPGFSARIVLPYPDGRTPVKASGHRGI